MTDIEHRRFRTAELVMYGALILCCLAGLFTIRGYNHLPVQVILDVAIAALVVASARSLAPGAGILLFMSVAYLATKSIIALTNPGTGVIDYVQAYKAFIFLVPICLLCGDPVFSIDSLARLTRVILPMFAVKYGATIALHLATSKGTRPGLLDENNFELVFLIGVFYLAYPAIGRYRAWWLLLLAVTVGLSQSRSGVVELAIMAVFLFIKFEARRVGAYVLALVASGALVYYTFSERMSAGGGLQSIDRYHFLEIFRQELSHWSAFEYLFGTPPLTPLSNASCQQLQYYSTLFSAGSSERCYSVVLHAFALRGVFDQGALGLLLLIMVVWRAMRVAGASLRDAGFVLALITANSLSVSGFNSEYALLVILVAVALDRRSDSTGQEQEMDCSAQSIHRGSVQPRITTGAGRP